MFWYHLPSITFGIGTSGAGAGWASSSSTTSAVSTTMASLKESIVSVADVDGFQVA